MMWGEGLYRLIRTEACAGSGVPRVLFGFRMSGFAPHLQEPKVLLKRGSPTSGLALGYRLPVLGRGLSFSMLYLENGFFCSVARCGSHAQVLNLSQAFVDGMKLHAAVNCHWAVSRLVG